MKNETPALANKTLTSKQVLDWFRDNGVSIADWADNQDFSRALVYAILNKERKCVRGQSYKIALALGLKSSNNNQDR
jgi:gp16 family phage-associated protein